MLNFGTMLINAGAMQPIFVKTKKEVEPNKQNPTEGTSGELIANIMKHPAITDAINKGTTSEKHIKAVIDNMLKVDTGKTIELDDHKRQVVQFVNDSGEQIDHIMGPNYIGGTQVPGMVNPSSIINGIINTINGATGATPSQVNPVTPDELKTITSIPVPNNNPYTGAVDTSVPKVDAEVVGSTPSATESTATIETPAATDATIPSTVEVLTKPLHPYAKFIERCEPFKWVLEFLDNREFEYNVTSYNGLIQVEVYNSGTPIKPVFYIDYNGLYYTHDNKLVIPQGEFMEDSIFIRMEAFIDMLEPYIRGTITAEALQKYNIVTDRMREVNKIVELKGLPDYVDRTEFCDLIISLDKYFGKLLEVDKLARFQVRAFADMTKFTLVSDNKVKRIDGKSLPRYHQVLEYREGNVKMLSKNKTITLEGK